MKKHRQMRKERCQQYRRANGPVMYILESNLGFVEIVYPAKQFSNGKFSGERTYVYTVSNVERGLEVIMHLYYSQELQINPFAKPFISLMGFLLWGFAIPDDTRKLPRMKKVLDAFHTENERQNRFYKNTAYSYPKDYPAIPPHLLEFNC